MKSVLHEQHIDSGAVMVRYSGRLFPQHYRDGYLAEHKASRMGIGILDVSFMGVVEVSGDGAEPLLDYLSTNAIRNCSDNTATYTLWSNEWGGCVDDVTIYRCDQKCFLIIVNGDNLLKDLEHLKRIGRFFDVTISDRTGELNVFAVQGPRSKEVLERVMGSLGSLKSMHFVQKSYQESRPYILQTGYGGPLGFEMVLSKQDIPKLWSDLLQAGANEGVVPIGLEAREILRLEAGYARYGFELTEDIAPTETIAAWTVKWMKDDFVGKEALLRLESDPQKRFQYGLAISHEGNAREGSSVYRKGTFVGKITSGGFSPCLQKWIAIAMVNGPLAIGESVEVEGRKRKYRADVVKLPFYRH